MNGSLIKFLFCFYCAICSVHIAKARVLKISGVSSDQSEKLKQNHPTFFDDQISILEIDELVKKIMSLGQFETVTAYELENTDILIEAVPVKIISYINVVGNKIENTSTLIELTELHDGDKFLKKSIHEAGEKLKEFYGNRGYFNSVIEVKFDFAKKDSVGITFFIAENSVCALQSLEFQSKNKTLSIELANKAKSFLNKPLTQDLFDKIVLLSKDHFINHRYLSASIKNPEITYNADRTGASVIFPIDEPYKYDRIFKGNHKLSNFDLTRSLNQMPAAQLLGDPSLEISENIQSTYIQKGFAHAKVFTKLEESTNDFLKILRIQIEEGPQTKISKFSITGKVSRPTDYYLDLLMTQNEDLEEKGFYVKDKIESAANALILELQNQGYLKAKLQSIRTEFTNNNKLAQIQIVMEEGPLTQIRKIEFNNVKSFTQVELLETISLRANSPLKLNEILNSVELLKQFYHSKGFLEMKIKNIDDQLVKYNEKGTEAQILFDIYEGPRILVSSIAIEGNTFTQDFVILREIDFQIGDYLTPANIEESQLRLNRLGIFNQVSIRTLEENSPISQRTVLISLTERDPGQFKIGFGADSDRNLTLRQYTALSYNNLFGAARGLSGRVELGYNPDKVKFLTHRVTAGYFEPFLFNSRTRGRVNITRQQYVNNYDETHDYVEVIDSSKIDFLLERDLTRSTKLTWTFWSLDSIREFVGRGVCIDEEKKICPNSLDRIALIGPTFDIDFRDNQFLPTKGSHTRWSLFYSEPNLGSSVDVEFIKSELSYTYLWNLGRPQLIWANQIRGGFAKNLSDVENSKIPDTHIFFLGGTSTMRGFGGSGADERIPNSYEFEDNEVVVKDKTNYYLFKSEFRFPFSDSFGGVVFYDGGSVYVDQINFERTYRHAVGFGIRIFTPIGPVSLDLGFKLNPKEDRSEDPFRFHFFIGAF